MDYLDNTNHYYNKAKENYYYRYAPINKCNSTFYSSGIVNRPTFLKTLRITFLNTSQCFQNFNFSIYDWTSGNSVLIKSTNILLHENQGRLIDILLRDCSINIELYEIRVTPYYNKLLINSYNI